MAKTTESNEKKSVAPIPMKNKVMYTFGGVAVGIALTAAIMSATNAKTPIVANGVELAEAQSERLDEERVLLTIAADNDKDGDGKADFDALMCELSASPDMENPVLVWGAEVQDAEQTVTNEVVSYSGDFLYLRSKAVVDGVESDYSDVVVIDICGGPHDVEITEDDNEEYVITNNEDDYVEVVENDDITPVVVVEDDQTPTPSTEDNDDVDNTTPTPAPTTNDDDKTDSENTDDVVGEIVPVTPEEDENNGEDTTPIIHICAARNEVVENVYEATCTVHGHYDLVKYCTSCGKEISRRTVTVPALGHVAGNVVTENVVAATCENKGSYDEIVYCDRCEEELSRQTITIDSLGHKAGETVVENKIDATCEANGSYEEVVYCTSCGTELSRTTKVVESLVHDYVESDRVDAQEGVEGYIEYTCQNCGKVYRETIDALDHEHHYVVDENSAIAPTCTETGKEADEICECGDTIYGATIPAIGHNYVTDEDTYVAPTTKENGKEADKVCTNCGDTILGAEIEKLPEDHIHNYVVDENSAIAPTCTETGKEANEICECGDTIYGATIDALGHDYVESNRVEATVNADGFIEYNCTRCGDTYCETIAALTVETTLRIQEIGQINSHMQMGVINQNIDIIEVDYRSEMGNFDATSAVCTNDGEVNVTRVSGTTKFAEGDVVTAYVRGYRMINGVMTLVAETSKSTTIATTTTGTVGVVVSNEMESVNNVETVDNAETIDNAETVDNVEAVDNVETVDNVEAE
jgi:hypothetical protein